MRKALALGLVASFAIGAIGLPAAAGKGTRTQRRVQDSYISPSASVEAADRGAWACNHGNAIGNLGCVHFLVAPQEKFIEVEIEDAYGGPVAAYVGQEGTDTWRPVCGKTASPLRIEPGVDVTIWIYPTRQEPLCPGVATRGTVTVILSNRR